MSKGPGKLQRAILAALEGKWITTDGIADAVLAATDAFANVPEAAQLRAEVQKGRAGLCEIDPAGAEKIFGSRWTEAEQRNVRRALQRLAEDGVLIVGYKKSDRRKWYRLATAQERASATPALRNLTLAGNRYRREIDRYHEALAKSAGTLNPEAM